MLIALDIACIEPRGGGAEAASAWQVNNVPLATHVKNEDKHVHALRCEVIPRKDEPRNLITLRPMLRYGGQFESATMPYNGLMMHVIAPNATKPPTLNSHVLAAFKNANGGEITDTLYNGVIIKKAASSRAGPKVRYIGSNEEKCISVEHIVVITSGSNPFGIETAAE